MNFGKNILYISSQDVCVFQIITQNKINILYSSLSFSIDYDALRSVVNKLNNISVVINSKSEYSEQKQFSKFTENSTLDKEVSKIIEEKTPLLWTQNNITTDDKHKKDLIITFVSEDSAEPHIKDILDILLKTKIKINYVTTFLLFTSKLKAKKNLININTYIAEKHMYVSLSNGSNFILGRKISYKNNEAITTTIAKSISIIIKYTNTTLSFLNSPININIFTTINLDIQAVKGYEPMLAELKYNIMPINMIDLMGVDVKGSILSEISIVNFLKSHDSGLSSMQAIGNKTLSLRNKLYILRVFLKFLTFSVVSVGVAFLIYLFYHFQDLTESSKIIDGNIIAEQDSSKNIKSSIVKKIDELQNSIHYLFNKECNFNQIDSKILDKIGATISKASSSIMLLSYNYKNEIMSDGKINNIFNAKALMYNANSSSKLTSSSKRLLDIQKKVIDLLNENGFRETNVKIEVVENSEYKKNKNDAELKIDISFTTIKVDEK
jgi:hypothetical protein